MACGFPRGSIATELGAQFSTVSLLLAACAWWGECGGACGLLILIAMRIPGRHI